MNPQVQVVVGEKAQASDGAAAGQIAAMIGNMAYATTTATEGGGTMEVEGGTTTCTPEASECDPGSAEGEVTLSWEAIGMVGELQQRQMNCSIYDTGAPGMGMLGLDDGGDSGTFCNSDSSYAEVFTPSDTVGTTLVGACQTGAGADVSILESGEFANEICTVCYNYCDIALGCEPHLMTEWVNITCSEMSLGYDCESEQLVLAVDDDALRYYVFTDDMLTKDILDDDSDLIGQSYLGKMLLGQHEYYVEDVTDDTLTIVCGETGTATTAAPMEYTPPAEGSVCDAADSDDTYSIKLVGAQTIEEKGVVDVTLEVTKPDGTTEQVTSGTSGTPVVGDLKVKLQRGTAASNVITGEQSFSADLLVWYVPSEYTFEDGEQYTEEGVLDDDGIWELDFNGGDTLYVYDLGPDGDDLEDDEELVEGTPLLSDISENEQWDDCYDEVETDDNDTEIVRYLEFSLERETGETDLPEGDMIQFPFNDGKYLLSDLKFGYLGLMNDDFLDDNFVDATTLDIDVSNIDVENETGENEGFYRMVEVDFVDQWGDSLKDVRLDEGPYEDGDMFFDCNEVVRIDSIEYSEGKDEVVVEYSIKDGSDWTEYEKESDGEADDACNISTVNTEAAYENVSVMSQVEGLFANFTDGWHSTACGDSSTPSEWIINNLSESSESAWEIWVDKDDDGVMAVAETCDTSACGCADDGEVRTEFKNDVWFCAYDQYITVDGATDSGAEDEVVIALNDATNVSIEASGCSECALDDNDCRDIAEDADDDGTMISLSGATITIDNDEIEEPEDTDEDTDVISQVTMEIPEDELRPTLFFGIQSALNETSITLTEADQGTVVNIGGVDTTVEEFGVSISGGGIVTGNESTVSCPSQTVTCPDVEVETKAPADLTYKLVVVEGGQSSGMNMVLVGGPSVNSLTKDLVTVDELCPDSEAIKLSGSKLVVAGCEAADTAQAADALVSWLESNVA